LIKIGRGHWCQVAVGIRVGFGGVALRQGFGVGDAVVGRSRVGADIAHTLALGVVPEGLIPAAVTLEHLAVGVVEVADGVCADGVDCLLQKAVDVINQVGQAGVEKSGIQYTYPHLPVRQQATRSGANLKQQ
jgi:hypothetical protein